MNTSLHVWHVLTVVLSEWHVLTVVLSDWHVLTVVLSDWHLLTVFLLCACFIALFQEFSCGRFVA